MEPMNYNWLIDAAGTNPQRMAELSLLFAGAAIASAQAMTPETKAQTVKYILAYRAAMHEIGVRMHLEKEMAQAVKDVWGTTG